MQRQHVYNNFLAQIIPMAAQMAAFILLVRWLDPAGMGVWSFYLMLHFFVESLRTAFIHNGWIKYAQDEALDSKALLASAWALQLSVSAVLVGLFTVACQLMGHYWDMPGLDQLGYFYVLSAIPAALYQMGLSANTAQMRFAKIRNGSMGMAFTWLGGTLAWGLLSERPLLGLQAVQVASYTAGALAMGMGRSWFPEVKPQRELVGRLFAFGKFSAGSSIGSLVYQKLDILVIGWLLNPAAVGLYSVATRINNYMDVPLNTVSQVVYPKLAQQLGRDRGKIPPSSIFEEPLALMLAITIPGSVAVFIFAELIIDILAGPAYEQAAMVLRIFAAIAFAKPFGRLFGIALDASGRPNVNFRIVWLSLAFNGVLNLIAVPLYGINGAAAATLAAHWITVIVGQFYLRSLFRVEYVNILRRMGALYGQAYGMALKRLRS